MMASVFIPTSAPPLGGAEKKGFIGLKKDCHKYRPSLNVG